MRKTPDRVPNVGIRLLHFCEFDFKTSSGLGLSTCPLLIHLTKADQFVGFQQTNLMNAVPDFGSTSQNCICRFDLQIIWFLDTFILQLHFSLDQLGTMYYFGPDPDTFTWQGLITTSDLSH